MEAELVGIDNLMPQIIWDRYFLEAQGFTVNDNVVYEDNQSEIKMGKTRISIALGTPGTLIYVNYVLRIGLKAKKFHCIL